MNRKIIVFAPHPDDETLGCGGTIAKKTSEEYEAFVVVLTDGRHAFSKVLGINSDPNPDEIKQIRKEEVIKATKMLGVPITNLLFLDFEDGTLGKHEKEAEEEIAGILRKHFPVEVYFPHRRDGHPDHQVANRIIRRCLKKLGLTSANYQYSIKHKYSRIGPLIERLLGFFKNSIIEVDISEYFDLKQKAIEEFRSEILLISSKQKKPVIEKIDEFLGAKEKFYIVKKS
jgi:LmbE family N-acetylglucosaminyl deacetylase